MASSPSTLPAPPARRPPLASSSSSWPPSAFCSSTAWPPVGWEVSLASRVYRTPDERFIGLPHFPFAPCYVEVGGLRTHYLDEGAGEPILLLHGEPTWSFLYRSMIAALRPRFRCIAPDYVGFGRSDKLTEVDAYSFGLPLRLARALRRCPRAHGPDRRSTGLGRPARPPLRDPTSRARRSA